MKEEELACRSSKELKVGDHVTIHGPIHEGPTKGSIMYHGNKGVVRQNHENGNIHVKLEQPNVLCWVNFRQCCKYTPPKPKEIEYCFFHHCNVVGAECCTENSCCMIATLREVLE